MEVAGSAKAFFKNSFKAKASRAHRSGGGAVSRLAQILAGKTRRSCHSFIQTNRGEEVAMVMCELRVGVSVSNQVQGNVHFAVPLLTRDLKHASMLGPCSQH